ncbi:hypothetical protein ColLi_13150 [Colletotrichum liriopes]|uniref:Uncharacterized protein n=1 Tax=Colletotrichum liriopes TaxID=708192 RepID=A0AA37LZ97_9PEZI|nr:hypothetical protein ColLi_13150 [Colletotrichum liriopes]
MPPKPAARHEKPPPDLAERCAPTVLLKTEFTAELRQSHAVLVAVQLTSIAGLALREPCQVETTLEPETKQQTRQRARR